MKTKLIVLLTGLLFLTGTSGVFAEEGHQNHVEVRNKICPVSGEKVGEMGDIVKVEYNGKVYNLCCAMCKKDFLNDPEKYSKMAEEEIKEIQTDPHTDHNHNNS